MSSIFLLGKTTHHVDPQIPNWVRMFFLIVASSDTAAALKPRKGKASPEKAFWALAPDIDGERKVNGINRKTLPLRGKHRSEERPRGIASEFSSRALGSSALTSALSAARREPAVQPALQRASI